MFTLVLVFKTVYPHRLATLVASLITDGGVIDTPTVNTRDDLVEMTALFSEATGTRLVSKFVREWADSDQEVEFIGLRDA